DQAKFNVFFVSVNAQQLMHWGEGFLAPQYETRALHLADRGLARPASATVHVTVFEDRNQNGVIDPGELPLSPAFIQLDGYRYRTDAKGEIIARVAPGRQLVRLLARGAVVGYFVPTVTIDVQAAAGEVVEARFALRPAGKVGGRIEPRGEGALD